MEETYNAALAVADDETSVRQLQSADEARHSSEPSTILELSRPDYQSPNEHSIDPSLEGEELPSINGSHSHPMQRNGSVSQVAPHHQQKGQSEQQSFTDRLFTNSPATASWRTPALGFEAPEPSRLPPSNLGQATDGSSQSAGHKRMLPIKDVTEQNIEEAYVAFILYCNPTIPVPADLTDLKRGFRNPPKSDGKTFGTFTLYQLIRKLESKEIKSWSQLALTLGVEPPSVEKKQSTQKVQQYAVRLKVGGHRSLQSAILRSPHSRMLHGELAFGKIYD